MEKETVFIKVKVVDRLPSKKDTYLTDLGVCNFDPDTGKFSQNTGKFSQIVTQDGYGSYIVEFNPTFWMEEVELPSVKAIDREATKLPRHAYLPFNQGVNFILNKLKGETK